MRLELTKSQAERLKGGAIVKVFTDDNKALSLMQVNDKIASVKFDNSKPMFTRCVLSTSEATTLTLTTQETSEVLALRKANVKEYAVYRSSGYKATLQDIEGIKAKLSQAQYNTDIDYVNNQKVASVKAQQLLGKARKVIINTFDLSVIADNNASYQVIEYIDIE